MTVRFVLAALVAAGALAAAPTVHAAGTPAAHVSKPHHAMHAARGARATAAGADHSADQLNAQSLSRAQGGAQ